VPSILASQVAARGNMIKLALNLQKYRLDVNLIKRRASDIPEPLLPKLTDIANARAGNKVSRYFRHIFEHKNIRRILGTNLTLMFIATTFLPVKADALQGNVDQTIISPTPVITTTERVIQYPIDPIKITQGYRLFHPGIDLDGTTGDSVRPIKAGTVEAISMSKYNYGYAIIINHGNELTSLYAHLSKILVVEGEGVTTNTTIGRVGSTGHSTGDHLHLEIRDHGVPINPLAVLPR
jgi:murein DD-endopeptidase MepM/ murein hydrolase activator NlpD